MEKNDDWFKVCDKSLLNLKYVKNNEALITYISQLKDDINWNIIVNLNILGSGVAGTVYLVKYYGKEYALKRQKVLENVLTYLKNDFKDGYKNELQFYNWINTLPLFEQNHFIKMYGYRIFKCDHKQKLKDWQINAIKKDPIYQKQVEDLDKSPYCAEYLMEIGGVTLQTIINKMMTVNNIDENLIKKIACELLKTVKIMRRDGYVHGDIHTGNITILNNQIKLIDYGSAENINSANESILTKFEINTDLMMIISLLTNFGYYFINVRGKFEYKSPLITTYVKYIQKKGYWGEISKYIQTIYPKSVDIITKINKSADITIFDEEINKELGEFLYDVAFILYPDLDQKFWSKILNAKLPIVPPLLNQKELIYILHNYHNMDKLIKHFSE